MAFYSVAAGRAHGRDNATGLTTTIGSSVKYSGNVLSIAPIFVTVSFLGERARAPLLPGWKPVHLVAEPWCAFPPLAASRAYALAGIIGRTSDNLTGDNRDTVVTGRQAGGIPATRDAKMRPLARARRKLISFKLDDPDSPSARSIIYKKYTISKAAPTKIVDHLFDISKLDNRIETMKRDETRRESRRSARQYFANNERIRGRDAHAVFNVHENSGIMRRAYVCDSRSTRFRICTRCSYARESYTSRAHVYKCLSCKSRYARTVYTTCEAICVTAMASLASSSYAGFRSGYA